MFWVYVLQNPTGNFYIGHTDNLEPESPVIIEQIRSAENLREKTGRGLWCGLKSIQIDQALCDASAKLKTGNLHV